MVSQVHSGVIIGIKGALVTVEVESTPGLPEFSALGSNDPVVKDSKHRITSALRAINVPLPPRKIIVNLAPAGLPKRGTAFDLSIAMALLQSAGEINPNSTDETLFLGELALDGTLRPCSGVIPIGMTALLHGLTSMIVPVENSEEAACLPHLNVYVAHHLSEVLAHCKGETCLEKVSPLPWSEDLNPSHLFSEIIGQHVPKRALEIAAAGRHHILFVGPPGSGKSMLAQCLPQLLPPLGDSEAIEVLAIHSIAGTSRRMTRKRPYRSPHHHTSAVGLTGGGTVPRPGEVTLAHRGVLFLDEFPEFSRSALESLREPLSQGEVTVSRAGGRETFPSKFLLVATMNPCPCGYFGIDDHRCRCTLPEVIRYQQKLSQPILDRISLRVMMSPVEESELLQNREKEDIRTVYERVCRVRYHQEKKFGKLNGELEHYELVGFIERNPSIQRLLASLVKHHSLTYRAMDLVVQVALTIANLDGRDELKEEDLLEAVSYQWRPGGTIYR